MILLFFPTYHAHNSHTFYSYHTVHISTRPNSSRIGGRKLSWLAQQVFRCWTGDGDRSHARTWRIGGSRGRVARVTRQRGPVGPGLERRFQAGPTSPEYHLHLGLVYPKIQKVFKILSHRILRHIHEALNIDKNKD